MDEKKLYEQKLQAQLDEWRAEIDKLKAKANSASADAQLELSRQIEDLEVRLEEGSNRLSELSQASGEAWVKLREGLESAWDSLSTVREITVRCPLATPGRGQGEGAESASVISRTVLSTAMAEASSKYNR